jgi:hypothetical protein
LLPADLRGTTLAEQGQRLETVRIDTDGINLAAAVAAARKGPEVVLEATCGWYRAADDLAEVGAKVHLEKRSMCRIWRLGGTVGRMCMSAFSRRVRSTSLRRL